MSPSRKSETASQSSPELGPAADVFRAEDPDRAPLETVEVELEPQRQRPASWAVFGIAVGAILIWRLGTVAQWGGVVLVVMGAFRAWELVQSFRHAPGTFTIGEKEIVLPRGLHLGKPFVVKPDDITAVYFLRKSVPWNRASPVLVVELGDRAIAYPRDWFASESDQREVVMALLAQRSREPHAKTPPSVLADERVTLIVELGGGAGLVALAAVLSLAGVGGLVALAPGVAGTLLLWRTLNRRV
jgi:hypothetical protein